MSIRKPIPGTYEAALLRSFVTVMELSHSLGEYVSELAAAAIAARGEFNVAISGGSALEVGFVGVRDCLRQPGSAAMPVCVLPQFLNTGLHDVAETGLAIGMQNWHVFYVDERCVPFDSEQSNHHNASILYDKVGWCGCSG
jgi:Glucosamine-6-phosphate isomerases/6-phosphogluconolactonase